MAGFGRFILSIDARSLLCTRSCMLKFNQHVSKDATTYSNQVELPPKPKRPLCSFLLYINHIKQELTEVNPNMKPTEIIKEASKKWAVMDPIRKQDFKKQYNKNYELYLEELKHYQDSLTEEQKSLMLEQQKKHRGKSTTLDIRRKKQTFRKPKRPESAFLLYLNANRKDKRSDTNIKEFVSEVTKKWNDMSHAEKEKYMVQAATLMEQYKEDIVKWEKEMINLGHPDVVRRKNRNASSEEKQESLNLTQIT